MPSKSALRITIDVNGSPRTLLSARENKSGTLILRLKPARYYRPDIASTDTAGEFVEQRYSIHPTRGDPSGNSLHLTTRFIKSPALESWQFTKAVKTYNQFAPVFLKRVADLSLDEYKTTGSAHETISLGLMDPNGFTLFFMVLIGPADRIFRREDPLLDSKLFQYQFSLFSLVIMWSFLGITSHHTGDDIHFATTRDTEGLSDGEVEWMKEFMNGCDELHAAATFDVYRELSAKKYLDFLRQNEIFDPALKDALDWARFFSEGNTTIESMEWWSLFARRTPGQLPPPYRIDLD